MSVTFNNCSILNIVLIDANLLLLRMIFILIWFVSRVKRLSWYLLYLYVMCKGRFLMSPIVVFMIIRIIHFWVLYIAPTNAYTHCFSYTC